MIGAGKLHDTSHRPIDLLVICYASGGLLYFHPWKMTSFHQVVDGIIESTASFSSCLTCPNGSLSDIMYLYRSLETIASNYEHFENGPLFVLTELYLFRELWDGGRCWQCPCM